MNVALYMRISQEDDLKDESSSIKNQRDILYSYIKNNNEFVGATTYEFVDDGISGATFNRTAVQKMFFDIKNKNINCILVKDLSRLSRNDVEINELIEKKLYDNNVRLIAINDNYDTSKEEERYFSYNLKFKTIFNDYYIKDLSEKVRSGKKATMLKGTFIPSYAPFGYLKSDVKGKFVLDNETAWIVEDIFNKYNNGMSTTDIAVSLNKNKILTPSQFKAKRNSKKDWSKIKNDIKFWTRNSVNIILNDERYTGKAIYNRNTRKFVGQSQTKKVPKDEWIIIDDAYPKIITENQFNETKLRKQKGNKKERILYGKLKCGNCKRTLYRSGNINPKYYCETKKVTGNDDCFDGFIDEKRLEKFLEKVIRKHIEVLVDRDKVAESKKVIRIRELEQDVKLIEEKIEELEKESYLLYEKFVCGELDNGEYLEVKEINDVELNRLEENKKKYLVKFKDVNSLYIKKNKIYLHTYDNIKISKEIINFFIEEILVCGNLEIKVVFKTV